MVIPTSNSTKENPCDDLRNELDRIIFKDKTTHKRHIVNANYRIYEVFSCPISTNRDSVLFITSLHPQGHLHPFRLIEKISTPLPRTDSGQGRFLHLRSRDRLPNPRIPRRGRPPPRSLSQRKTILSSRTVRSPSPPHRLPSMPLHRTSTSA